MVLHPQDNLAPTTAKLVRMVEIDGLIYKNKSDNEITLRFNDGSHARAYLEGYQFSPVQVLDGELALFKESHFVTIVDNNPEYEIFGLTQDGRKQVADLVRK